jgi:hypothetical protein
MASKENAMAEKRTSEDEECVDKRGSQLSLPVSGVGLCVTCRHAMGCTLPGSLDGPVNACEEFDVLAPFRSRLGEPAVPDETNSPKARRLGHLHEGLCMDCRGRESCTFPKPDGGIWHCEEYE